MNKVSLKVVVGGRTYPLTVQESEVEKVQRAADEINRAIKQLQENFAVRDMQDLLAMTALQLSTKSGKTSPVGENQPAATADYTTVTRALQNLADEFDQLI